MQRKGEAKKASGIRNVISTCLQKAELSMRNFCVTRQIPGHVDKKIRSNLQKIQERIEEN